MQGRGSADREKLQEIVEKVNWVYGGLWHLSRDQRSVEWTDGYYNGPPLLGVEALVSSSQPWQQRRARRRILDEFQRGLRAADPNLTNNLSNTEYFYLLSSSACYPLGSFGTPAKMMMTGGFDWVCDAGDVSPLSFSRTEAAKAAGIKTVLCLAVQGGVVELGTTISQPEDIALVHFVRNVFDRSPGKELPESLLRQFYNSSTPSSNSNSTPPVSTDMGNSLPNTPRSLGLGQQYYTSNTSVQPSVQVGSFGLESLAFPQSMLNGLLRGQGEITSSPDMNLQQNLQQSESWALDQQLLAEHSRVSVNLKHKLPSTAGLTRSGSCVASFEQALIHPHTQLFPQTTLPVESNGKLLTDFQAQLFKNEFPNQQSQNSPREGTVVNSPQNSQSHLMETADLHWRSVAQPRNLASPRSRQFHNVEQDSSKRLTDQDPDVFHPSNIYLPDLALPSEHSYSSEAISPTPSEHQLEQDAEGGLDMWEGERCKKARLNPVPGSNLMSHCMAERKRREKLNEKFQQLRAMVRPHVSSKAADKASLLGDVIKYLSELQRRVKESESTPASSAASDDDHGMERSSSLTTSLVDGTNIVQLNGEYHMQQQFGGHDEGNLPILRLSDTCLDNIDELEGVVLRVVDDFPNIEVRTMENEQVMIKLSSKDRPGLFADIMTAMCELQLRVQHANIRTVCDVVHDVFAAKVDVCLSERQTTQDIAEAIRRAILRGNVMNTSSPSSATPDVPNISPRKRCFQQC